MSLLSKFNLRSAKSTASSLKPDDAMGFNSLGLRQEILDAIAEQGYVSPTPIQQSVIMDVAKGRDLLGCAQTGTGKTAAFALPTLERLSHSAPKGNPIRLLVLTPTRELALQVAESYQIYGKHLKLKTGVVFGGVSLEPQKALLKRGIDILVATPGRLLDLKEQGYIQLGGLEILVLDEADRMLDMGFLPDVRRILKTLPPKRQTLLFSATMPRDILELSMKILTDPLKVEVAPISSTAERVEQSVYFVNRQNKRHLLLHILKDPETKKVLIFSRTKAIANRLTKFLHDHGIGCEPIHGNKSQSARQRALDHFKQGKIKVLVATDIAARGIDVDEISHVINYDLPNVPETYVHRIGRTGRADACGKALSFCDGEERSFLRDIEALIKKSIPEVTQHPFPFDPSQETLEPPRPQRSTTRRAKPQPKPKSQPKSRYKS